ncbi:MAG: hypothetical protein HY290_30740, partial [Planctomycetia bacterium]|nr:hypothetical protein [Planctomycetia bacterium]
MTPMMLSIVIFLAVSGMAAAAAFAFMGGRSKAEDRLDVLAGLKTPELEARGLLKEEVLKEGVDGISGLLGRVASRGRSSPVHPPRCIRRWRSCSGRCPSCGSCGV